MKTAALVFALIVLVGCSSVGRIGTIGVYDIWQAKTCDTISPCTTTILTHNTKDGALNKIEGGSGPSIIGQVLGPASVATAGYFIGKGLEDSGDQISETNNVNSNSEGSTAQAAGGASSATGGKSEAYGGQAVSVSTSNSNSVANSFSSAKSNSLSNANSRVDIHDKKQPCWGW